MILLSGKVGYRRLYEPPQVRLGGFFVFTLSTPSRSSDDVSSPRDARDISRRRRSHVAAAPMPAVNADESAR